MHIAVIPILSPVSPEGQSPFLEFGAELLVELGQGGHGTKDGDRLIFALDPDLVELLPSKVGG